LDIVTKFESKVSSFLNGYSDIDVCLAAVSGGADSMAMLAALYAVNGSARLFCIHVEHALRPAEESMGDADFVRDFCRNNGIKCTVKHIPPGRIEAAAKRRGEGIEAAARFFRHRALRKQAALSGGLNTRILTAHTKDDALETALMRILRGCGPAGLAAMPADNGRILRPLLSMTRADVIEYLKAKNIPWREDSTNTDEKFLRNRIRRRLVPLLNDFFPSWKTGITAMSETQSPVMDFIGGEAETRIKWNCNKVQDFQTSDKKKYFSTDESSFFAQPLIIREEALFMAIDKLLKGVKNARSVKRSVIRRFCTGAVNAADLGSVRIKRAKGKILLSRMNKEYFECGVSILINCVTIM